MHYWHILFLVSSYAVADAYKATAPVLLGNNI